MIVNSDILIPVGELLRRWVEYQNYVMDFYMEHGTDHMYGWKIYLDSFDKPYKIHPSNVKRDLKDLIYNGEIVGNNTWRRLAGANSRLIATELVAVQPMPPPDWSLRMLGFTDDEVAKSIRLNNEARDQNGD